MTMNDPCAKCGERIDWCRCRYKHRDKSERSGDQTWTLFTRLWKRIAANASHEVMWSEATIRALLLKHPLPWHTDQDWTWEILDARDTYVTGGFRHEIDALDYIAKAHTVV